MTYNKGKIIKGIVSGIEPYGIFLNLEDNYTGLIHISEISTGFVKDPNMYAKIGDDMFVEILSIDEKNKRLNLSIKNITCKGGKIIRKKRIIETSSGFETLNHKLPFWIQENLKNHKNKINSIDKQ